MIKSEHQPVKADTVDENGHGGWLSSYLTKKNGYPENGGEGRTLKIWRLVQLENQCFNRFWGSKL